MVRRLLPFFAEPVGQARGRAATFPSLLHKPMRFLSLLTRSLLLAGLLLALGRPAAAQLLAPGQAKAYDFLTVTMVESTAKSLSKLLIAPAFNGRTEIQLDAVAAFSPSTRLDQLRRNNEVLTQSLGELSAAGWELIQVSPATLATDKDVSVTRYLLRKAKS